MKKAVVALRGMLGRLQSVAGARVVLATMKNELELGQKASEITGLLPKNVQSAIHALQVPWPKECEQILTMDHGSLDSLIAKLDIAEAAAGVSSGKLDLDDPAFEKAYKECGNFAKTFVSHLKKVLEEGGNVFTNPLDTFSEKYSEVKPCVEAWTLKDIEWAFMKDTEGEVKQDLSNLKQARKDALAYSDHLSKLAQYQSPFEDIQGLAKLANEWQAKFQAKVGTASALGNILVFAHLIVCGNPGKQDVAQTEKYSQRYYGLGCSNLPKVLQDKVEVAKKSTVVQEKPKEKEDQKDKKKRESDASKPDKAEKEKKVKKQKK